MTGTELMSGDTIDSNSAFLGNFFSNYGITIKEKVTVADDETMLIEQIIRLSAQYDLLFINGGLGPTQDDLTASVLAQATQQKIIRHQVAEQHVHQWCANRALIVNKANLKQADLPEKAQIFPNAPGSACAFYLYLEQCLIIATPGVPSELKTITTRDIAPFLTSQFSLNKQSAWQKYQLFGFGESSLQQLLDQQFPSVNDDFIIGFRVNFPYLELKFQPRHARSKQTVLAPLLTHLHEHILGDGNSTAASALINALKEKQLSFSSAESCTGGLIASQITQIPGASDVFPGSIVSYSNAIKQHLLFVDAQTLNNFGAVSEQTVKSMHQGILQQMQCNYAVAVSGIAGPTGEVENKPVGTVWIAWGNLQNPHTLQLRINQPREDFQILVSAIAMDLVRRQIQGYDLQPYYLSRWQKNLVS